MPRAAFAGTDGQPDEQQVQPVVDVHAATQATRPHTAGECGRPPPPHTAQPCGKERQERQARWRENSLQAVHFEHQRRHLVAEDHLVRAALVLRCERPRPTSAETSVSTAAPAQAAAVAASYLRSCRTPGSRRSRRGRRAGRAGTAPAARTPSATGAPRRERRLRPRPHQSRLARSPSWPRAAPRPVGAGTAATSPPASPADTQHTHSEPQRLEPLRHALSRHCAARLSAWLRARSTGLASPSRGAPHAPRSAAASSSPVSTPVRYNTPQAPASGLLIAQIREAQRHRLLYVLFFLAFLVDSFVS